jgi:hypothetical protein
MKRLASLAVIAMLTTSCTDRRLTFEIPSGYTGFASVKFGKHGCDDSRDLLKTTIRLDSHGHGCTATAAFPPTAFTHYYYVEGGRVGRELRRSGWGEGGEIWAESTEIDRKDYRFFVGSEQQLRAAWKAKAVPTSEAASVTPN